MIQTFIDVVLHLDQHLAAWSASMGPWLYVVLFLVIFCETGLIVTPFLPGDSLLFAIGALCAIPGSGLEIVSISATLIVAAILGDGVNYKIGYNFGAKAMAGEYRLINKKHLLRTQQF